MEWSWKGRRRFICKVIGNIRKNRKQHWAVIFWNKTNVSELIQFGAKTEDIQKLREQIRISNESVIKNLKGTFNEELKKAAERLEESFKNNLIDMRISESNLSLVTPLTKLKFNRGNRDCWKLAHLSRRYILKVGI